MESKYVFKHKDDETTSIKIINSTICADIVLEFAYFLLGVGFNAQLISDCFRYAADEFKESK